MLKRTSQIRQEMLLLDESFNRLQLLKDKYKDKTAYILATGPSLGNHNVNKLKEILSDKFVLGMKQSYDLYGDIIDIHLMNFCNYKDYNYDEETIVSWIVYMQNQPDYILQNNIKCDFMMPLVRNHAGYENTIAYQRDFDSLLIDKSFERPWGSGIMYESGFPLALYCGCKKIVTIGWDIGILDSKNEGKAHIKYDHFYSEGTDGEKTKYGEHVIKTPVGGSAGMSHDETKMVVDSTEDLHKFLESIDVELNIVSDRNPASNKIKRIELDEI